MSLRALILQHSLPLLPRHSFSRQTLSAALQSVQSGPENAETAHSFLESASPTATTRRDPIGLDRLDDIGRENVIDTLFGSGTIAPARALLDAWQDAGLSAMESSEHPQSDVSGRLERRLEYSAGVGEHLVEAYALMSAPTSAPSIPLPSLPRSILSQLSSLSVPPLYQPPESQHNPLHKVHPNQTGEAGPKEDLSASTLLDKIESATGGRLPLLRLNPFGPLGYAWNIADRALAIDEKQQGIKNGLMDEPVGSGPEWYTARIALGLAYLAAESHLLQPFVRSALRGNPHLESAKTSLRSYVKQYDGLRETVESSEEGTKDIKSMLEFLGRGAVGLLRSRGL